MIKERNWKVDYLKGIGIFFVLMGHILSGGITYNFIFNFHMELFFAIAGYLLYFNSDVNFKQFIIRKFKALIIPYYVLCLLSFAFVTIVNYNNLPYLDYKKILGIIIFDSKCLIYISNLPLWFLSHLFFCYIALYFIKQTKLLINILVILFCMIIVLPYQKYVIDYAYSIGAFPVSITFMILGLNVAKYKNLICKKNILKQYSSIIGWLFILTGFILSNFYHGQTMFLNNRMVVLIACIIIVGLVMITQTGNKALEFVGRYSLYIFGIHNLFVRYIIMLYKKNIPNLTLTEGANEFFITLTLLIVCVILTYAYLKFKRKKTIVCFIVFAGIISLFAFEKFNIESKIKFSKNPPIIVSGFSTPESWGIWTNGDIAELEFNLRSKQDIVADFDINPFLADNKKIQKVKVLVNEKELANWIFEKDKDMPNTSLMIPHDIAPKGKVSIRFEIDNPQAPKELGLSDDSRKLGIGFKSMKIRVK